MYCSWNLFANHPSGDKTNQYSLQAISHSIYGYTYNRKTTYLHISVIHSSSVQYFQLGIPQWTSMGWDGPARYIGNRCCVSIWCIVMYPGSPGYSRGKQGNYNLGPLLLRWISFNPSEWISNYTHYKVWDEIIYHFQTSMVEVWKWISNFIPHFTEHMITYPCWDLGYFTNDKIIFLKQVQIKKNGKNKNLDIFYQMKVFLLRSVVGSVFCKSARCP